MQQGKLNLQQFKTTYSGWGWGLPTPKRGTKSVKDGCVLVLSGPRLLVSLWGPLRDLFGLPWLWESQGGLREGTWLRLAVRWPLVAAFVCQVSGAGREVR